VDGKVTFFKVGKVEKYQNWRLHSSVTQTVWARISLLE
jgi:hypothetical protein